MGKQVGTNIKDFRRKIPITQDEMAEKLNLKKTTYAGKEQRGTFTNEEIKKIAKLLSVTVEMIMEEDETFYDLDDAASLVKNNIFVNNQQDLIVTQKKIIASLEEKIKKLEQELENLRPKNTGGQRQSA